MNDYSINIQIFSNIADTDGWGMPNCGFQIQREWLIGNKRSFHR